jgi:hypothetical protein
MADIAAIDRKLVLETKEFVPGDPAPGGQVVQDRNVRGQKLQHRARREFPHLGSRSDDRHWAKGALRIYSHVCLQILILPEGHFSSTLFKMFVAAPGQSWSLEVVCCELHR